uniref:Putative ribonuclease H-like domain-containing protein n=1 Tax=Tanacetum cinerariifolium TaxID=118510 RepID=A0A699GWG9_TANCI|nr:putative ribonuclease H-like domain-containing protein [Tanacetum cinerariifolium]
MEFKPALLQSFPFSNRVSMRCGGSSTPNIPGPVTADEKIQKKNDTGKKITINGSDTAGYDKAKVECFNCHKMGHFARECRVPRNQENKTKNQEITRRTVNVEDTSYKVMMAIDGADFDWSYIADNEAPTNMAFMAFSDSEVYTDNTCFKTCLKNYETLKTQYDELRVEFNKSEYFEIAVLKSKLEKISKEKDDIEIKIKKFKYASQSLDKLIGSQITGKSKRGLGYVSYNAIPPPHTGRFSPLRIGLSHTGLPEFAEPSVESYGVKPIKVVIYTSSVKISEPVKENNDAPLIEDWESEGEDEVESPPEIERKTIKPSMDKVEVDIPKQNDKPARRPVKYVEMYRTQRPRGNQRKWNNLKFHQLVPKAVLTRTGLKPVKTVRPVNLKSTKRSLMKGMLHLGGAKGGKITGKGIIRTADESHVLLKVPRKNNMYNVDMKNIVPKKDLTCLVVKATNDESMLWHKRLGHINFKNTNKLVKEILVRGFPSKRFENDQTCIACLKGKQHKVSSKSKIQNSITLPLFMLHKDLLGPTFNRVLVVKPHFKTPHELFRGRTHALSFMRPFGCHVTILNTLDYLGKFDGKSNKGFFVGYSINSKAFRVYNTRTRKVEENLHINFLENKPIIIGTNSNDFTGKRASFNADSDGDNKDNDGPCKESDINNKEISNGENSTKDVNTTGPSINTVSSNINTTSLTVNTVRLNDDFFGADNDIRSLDGVEGDISNISTTYPVPTTPNTRIHKDYSLNNMDIKSAFLYGRIEEEVYVCQPPGFEDPDYPDKVYKVEKALYGLHQAPRAWYETLAKYLLGNGFHRGKFDQTMFIKRQAEDILLVQVYVDDIIFGSTKKELCTMFEKLMHGKFQMSSIGEVTFFLGLQVKQKSDEIFISQDKYVDEILRKFKYADVKPASTPMEKETALLKDSDGDDGDVYLYRSMISYGALLVPENLTIDIELNATVDGQDKTITKASVMRHLKLIDADDEAITKEMHDGLERATTTASSLEAEWSWVPRYHGGSPIQASPERLSNLPNEPPLGEGNTSRSGEGKDEEGSLDKEDSPKQGRMIKEIDEDENTNLVKSSKQGEVHDTAGHKIKSDDTKVVDFSTASPKKDDDEITLAETLVNIKKSATKDKCKAFTQESEPLRKSRRKR